MTIFMNAMYILIILGIMLYPGYCLTLESYRLATGGDKAPMSVALQGLVPIWNNFVIRKLLYGASSAVLRAYFLLIPIVVFRAVALVTHSSILLSVTAILDIVGIFMCWAIASYVAIDVGRMIEVSGFKMFLCIIIPPLGCYVIARNIGPYLKHSNDEVEDTFLENE